MSTHLSDQGAVIEEITTAIEASHVARADEYDLEQIAAACYEYVPEMGGFVQIVDADGFWAEVQKAER